jgi:hypothetical protein
MAQVRRTSVRVLILFMIINVTVWYHSQSHLHSLRPGRHSYQHYEGVTCFVMRELSLPYKVVNL